MYITSNIDVALSLGIDYGHLFYWFQPSENIFLTNVLFKTLDNYFFTKMVSFLNYEIEYFRKSVDENKVILKAILCYYGKVSKYDKNEKLKSHELKVSKKEVLK